MSFVPPGTIISYVGTNPSSLTGWLYCNGASVSAQQYPFLFDAIGETFGSSGSGNFNLPDLRGYFLRGVNDGSGNDPDAGSRSSQDPNGTGNSGDEVGTVQGDAFATHTHVVTAFGYDSFHSGGDYSSCYPSGEQATGPTGGQETRPRNLSCYYLIFVGS